jgi:hypothetical protein
LLQSLLGMSISKAIWHYMFNAFGADDQRISETNSAFWLDRPNSIVVYNRSVVILEYCCCRRVGFICRIEELPEVVGVKLEDHRIYMVILAEHGYTSIRSEPWRDELDRRWTGLDEGRVAPTSFLRDFWWHHVLDVEVRVALY